MWSAKKGAIGLLRSVDGAGAANGFDSCLGRVTRCTRSRSMLKSMLNTEEHTAAPPSSTKTCLVAYDHPAVTHLVSRLLLDRGFEVVAAVQDGGDALYRIVRLRPDIALLDLSMPSIPGIEVARRAAVASPETRVLLYTRDGQDVLLKEALAAGVQG